MSTQPSSQPSGQSSDQLYLDRLKFDPALRQSFFNLFVTRPRVVLLIILALLTWGTYAFVTLPRESNPEVKIPVGVVLTSFPGASPADVEELVTKKLETKIAAVRGVEKISSTSATGFSQVSVEFAASEELSEALRRLREAVDLARPDLPPDGDEPTVKEVSFDDQPILTVALSGPLDGQTLRRAGEKMQDELEKIAGVREVQLAGGDETEFAVTYRADRLAELGLSAEGVNATLRATNTLLPAGDFTAGGLTTTVRADSRFFTAATLAAVPVLTTPAGAVVPLADVATVAEQAVRHTVLSRLAEAGGTPHPAITISILKKAGSSILETVQTAQKTVQTVLPSLPAGLTATTVVDFSDRIAKDFTRLTHDFLITILLVGLILFLVVGVKEAFVAGLAVPLTFCATFGVMAATGTTLNFLSLFSLILSLGLLVDDAIVVVSATKQYLRSGRFTPEEAVLLVLRDFKVVLLTTTLTTIWAFLPLLMSTGMIGEFIKSIPITVSTTLGGSLFIALAVNHPLAAVLERLRFTPTVFWLLLGGLAAVGGAAFLAGTLPLQIVGAVLFAVVIALVFAYRRRWRTQLLLNAQLVAAEWADDARIRAKLVAAGAPHADWQHRIWHGIWTFNAFLPRYEAWLRALLATTRRRRQALAAVFLLFLAAVSLPATGVVPSQFFPPSDQEYVFINVELPVGSALAVTARVTEQAEKVLLQHPEIATFATTVGRGTVANNQVGSANAGSSHLAGITVRLVGEDARAIKSYDLAEKLRVELKNLPGATRVTVDAPGGGPPAGSAFEVRLVGEDLAVLEKIGKDLQKVLTAIPGVIQPDFSLKPAPAEYTFQLDHARLKLAGLTAPTVAGALRMAVSGLEVTRVVRGGDELKVVAHFDARDLPDLAALRRLPLVNARGQAILLGDVADIRLTPAVSAITRQDQKRVVTLSADVTPGTLPASVLAEFQKRAAAYQFPAGYHAEYGGENEENAKSVASILRAMVVAALLIVVTLVLQFNSFRQAAIVLATIPLALTGVFFGLAVLRLPLSFPGLIGILALFGIVVKNAIILVDKINLNLRAGIPFVDAIVDAGKSRLEAIVITSICTIFGILPVTLSNATWTALGSAIICGLLLSSFLTLFVVPLLFAGWVQPPRATASQT